MASNFKQPTGVRNIYVLNVNSDRRLSKSTMIGRAFPEKLPTERESWYKVNILSVIEDDDLVVLFELTDDMLESFMKFAEHEKLFTSSFKYNESNGSFNFLVVSKHGSAVRSTQSFSLTQSGKPFDDAKRPQAPKPGETPSEDFLAYKKEIFGDNFDKSAIRVVLSTVCGEVDLYCTHLGLTNDAKLKQTEKLAEVVSNESLARGRKFIVAGDFNSFDQLSAKPILFQKQVNAMMSIPGLKHNSSEIGETFVAYPYDICFKFSKEEQTEYRALEGKPLDDQACVAEFREFCLEKSSKYGLEGGPLDQVFSHGVNVAVTATDVGTSSDHKMMGIFFI